MSHSVDQEQLKYVTDAIQAQERLQLSLRSRKCIPYFNKVYPEVCKTLDTLRNVKSDIEGTSVTFESVTVVDEVLQELKPYVLMNVPQSLTSDVKSKIKQLVLKAFNGSCRDVLYAALVTCPWYSATQTERGQQAKYNHLLVVYCSKDEQFFSPINPHLKESFTNVIDKGWFYGIEVSHFAENLLRGKVRFIETLYRPESAVIFSSVEWASLKMFLESTNCLNLRGFLEQCRGQAIGSVGKKSKATGKMVIRDGTSLHDFCDSFRLLHHATASLLGEELSLEVLDDDSLSPEIVQEAMHLLKISYQMEQCNKLELFALTLKWRTSVDKLMMKCTYTPISEVQTCVSQWLIQVRMKGKLLPKEPGLDECEKEKVQRLLSKSIGGPVNAMLPENIIMITRAGSYLYNLDTVESDTDYIIVYTDPIQKVLASCSRPNECAESRGLDKTVEYGAYEVRRFCEMLWKGSVVMLEILHKLYCLEYILKRECPQVRCEKATREYILRVRKGPLEGDLAREQLYEECRYKLDILRKNLSQRTTRLPENIDYKYLANWLLMVRGWGKVLN